MLRNTASAMVLAALLAGCEAAAPNDPLLAEHEAVFGPFNDYTPPQYDALSNEAVYITMRDGVRIALDVTLPSPLAPDTKLPAILLTTRYWRARQGQEPGDYDHFFTGHGYAVIRADERGTGASFGTWQHLWPPDAIADYGETAEWIASQPWSNGKVGGIGVSYVGTTAQLLAVPNHPAVKAVVPKFMEFDVYTDIGLPGGIPLEWMIDTWLNVVRQLDRNEAPGGGNRKVKPVDADTDGTLLAEAVAEHQNSPDIRSLMKVSFRDEPGPGLETTWDDFSVHTYLDEIERSGVAIYGWGSWNDAGTADAVIRRFMTLSNPQRGVIGPWNHGGGLHTSQYLPDDAPTNPSSRAQWLEDLRFFDYYLKGVDTGIMNEKVIVYYTMGEAKWKRTATWPVSGVARERWYLDENQTLMTEAPSAPTGSDRYEIDFEATTGTATRWHTEMGGDDVIYGDRADNDERLLTYTSPPLETDLEVTGYPLVLLHVAPTHEDGAIYAYLEDVHPDGRVTYVTEGQLRALTRKVSSEEPPYRVYGPYHTSKTADGASLVPGEVAEFRIGLQPTSVMFKQGHRIRLALAGHDAGLFARIPKTGDPAITVERNANHASFLELPVVK